ncbi:MAG: sphingomyelin phosphodiesterase [Bacteroidetes bacterium]|nr:sphingomyelin phosphodiesterase [Bacteroidota bacterium]
MIKKYLTISLLLVFCATVLSAQDSNNKVHILSWNIKMLPRGLVFLKHHPVKRAKLIPAHLLSDSIDVICFQEAFDPRARRLLKKGLRAEFPYVVGPANNWASFRVNSGVMMFSRYPMKQLGQTRFSTCEKEDCMARKGGLMCEVEKGGRKIQLLGTHCEAGGSKEMKVSQFYELKDLADKFANDTTPLFYLGDFNCARNNINLYPDMITALNASDGDITGDIQCTADHQQCDMLSLNPNGTRKVIDFVLERNNAAKPVRVKREVRRYRQTWHKNHTDLSDHYAVYAVCEW